MTTTGTQNRPYTNDVLGVRVTLEIPGRPIRSWVFNWNDRAAVRYFAAQSDDCIRANGKTTLASEYI